MTNRQSRASNDPLDIFSRSPDLFTVFSEVKDPRPSQRDECLRAAEQLLLSWYHGFGSPKEESMLQHPQEHIEFTHWGDDSMYYLIEQQLPDLLRLMHTCPWKDVRIWCTTMLDRLQRLNIQIPMVLFHSPSTFIDASQIDGLKSYLDDHSSTVAGLLVDHFCEWGRVENFIVLMSYHPEYLECFNRLYNHLMGDCCPLPYADRHYICIMAAARHRCDYLIRLHVIQFILQKGNQDWLKGIQYAPARLQKLAELNKYLAHRPWDITPEHFHAVTRDRGSYTLSELMHAVTLMSHTHALCSFLFGCGVAPEIDSPAGHNYTVQAHHANGMSDAGAHSANHGPTARQMNQEPLENLMNLMKSVGEEESAELSKEEVVQRFKTIQSHSLRIASTSEEETGRMENPLVKLFLYEPNFNYQPPDVADESTLFHIQDFSWEDIGISLTDQFINGLGQLLDDKFLIIYDLTYCTMGDHSDVDTGTFRRAVWHYVHSLFLVLHDDYNYACVERLLPLPLTSYLKATATMPSTVTKRDYAACMQDFKQSEKVHVNLIVMEARLQASLLYALRALKRSRL